MPTLKSKQFKPSLAAEVQFSRQLKKIAQHAGHIVSLHTDGHKIKNPDEMKRSLRAYSKLIEPWATRQAAKVLTQVSRKNIKAYHSKAKEMGRILSREMNETDTGFVAETLLREQVELIKSIPLNAGERAQTLALEAVTNGSRASEIAEALRRSTQVSESDAVRIARTEVAKASSAFTQARAQGAGSRHYRWRNSGDASVREAHKYYKGQKLDGLIFSWDSPPTLDDNTTGNPGTFPNCRCYPEPVFDEE